MVIRDTLLSQPSQSVARIVKGGGTWTCDTSFLGCKRREKDTPEIEVLNVGLQTMEVSVPSGPSDLSTHIDVKDEAWRSNLLDLAGSRRCCARSTLKS